MSLSGQNALKNLLSLFGDARESVLLAMAKDPDNLPPSLRGFVPVRWQQVVAGQPHEIEIHVSRDWFALGTDDDFLRTPMTPWTAQAVADYYDAILPSTRIVAKIEAAAQKIAPLQIVPSALPVPTPKMELTPAWAESQAMTQAALGAYDASSLVAGFKKDVVVGPNLDGSRVAIFGAQWPNGGRVQPYSTIHQSRYSDYSHGIRLVARGALLDGRPVDLAVLFRDPVLSALVSDQGPFVPRFPNVGAGAIPPAAGDGGDDGSGPGTLRSPTLIPPSMADVRRVKSALARAFRSRPPWFRGIGIGIDGGRLCVRVLVRDVADCARFPSPMFVEGVEVRVSPVGDIVAQGADRVGDDKSADFPAHPWSQKDLDRAPHFMSDVTATFFAIALSAFSWRRLALVAR